MTRRPHRRLHRPLRRRPRSNRFRRWSPHRSLFRRSNPSRNLFRYSSRCWSHLRHRRTRLRPPRCRSCPSSRHSRGHLARRRPPQVRDRRYTERALHPAPAIVTKKRAPEGTRGNEARSSPPPFASCRSFRRRHLRSEARRYARPLLQRMTDRYPKAQGGDEKMRSSRDESGRILVRACGDRDRRRSRPYARWRSACVGVGCRVVITAAREEDEIAAVAALRAAPASTGSSRT